MNILDFIFKQALRIKVVHSLPGRLRVHIPLLKSLSMELAPASEVIEELLFTVPGVNNVTPNYINGNLLILYEHGEIDQETVIRCIKVIWKTLITNRKHFYNLSVDHAEIISGRLIKHVKDSNLNLTNIVGEVYLPNDIWT